MAEGRQRETEILKEGKKSRQENKRKRKTEREGFTEKQRGK